MTMIPLYTSAQCNKPESKQGLLAVSAKCVGEWEKDPQK